jgi:hypothetical protein
MVFEWCNCFNYGRRITFENPAISMYYPSKPLKKKNHYSYIYLSCFISKPTKQSQPGIVYFGLLASEDEMLSWKC